MNYNAFHAEVANGYIDVKNKKVLVVGCNRGKDVSYFIEFGAQEVWGIDIIDEVGVLYPHEKAKYYQMSAENMDIQDNNFDLVYCFATMEHILKIEQAFAEMVRVTKPEGVIYCVASPLWNSRQGHHYSHIIDVDKYPWIHLTLTKEQIRSKCCRGEINYPLVIDIDQKIDRMFDSRYFNHRLAKDYVNVCNHLENINIIRNDLDLESEHYLALLSVDDFKILLDKNINSTELLALTHTFIASKLKKNDDPIESDQTNNLVEDYKLKLQITQNQLQEAQQEIEAMKTSKFWKLRSAWFKFKKAFKLLRTD